MGNRAKVRAGQRTELKRRKREVAALAARTEAHPDFAAMLASVDEPEVQALIAADLPGQFERLRRAGFAQREEGHAGVGIWDNRRALMRVCHSVGREADGQVWAHTSVSFKDDRLPAWYVIRDVQWIMYPGRMGIVVVAPEDEHVNISEVHHVWTCLTADPVPDFRRLGQV